MCWYSYWFRSHNLSLRKLTAIRHFCSVHHWHVISLLFSFNFFIFIEKCSIAITNLFYHLWRTEKEERREREEKRQIGNSNEFTKREVATCLSYIRYMSDVCPLTLSLTHSTSLPQSLTASIDPIYFILWRRLLQVDAVPCCSSPGEIIKAKSIHNTLVVQLRVSRIIKFLYLLFFTGTYAVALFLL